MHSNPAQVMASSGHSLPTTCLSVEPPSFEVAQGTTFRSTTCMATEPPPSKDAHSVTPMPTTCMVAEQRAPIHGRDNRMKNYIDFRGIPSWDGAEDTLDTFEVNRYHYQDRNEENRAQCVHDEAVINRQGKPDRVTECDQDRVPVNPSLPESENSDEPIFDQDGMSGTVTRSEDKDRDVARGVPSRMTATTPGASSSTQCAGGQNVRDGAGSPGRSGISSSPLWDVMTSCKSQVQKSIFAPLVQIVDSDDYLDGIKEQIQTWLPERVAGNSCPRRPRLPPPTESFCACCEAETTGREVAVCKDCRMDVCTSCHWPDSGLCGHCVGRRDAGSGSDALQQRA